MPRITDFCSCIYVFRCKLSLVRLCDSDFGITPVDDITIGITCAAFCFHIAHISFASSWYLFCLSIIVLMRLCVFGKAVSISDTCLCLSIIIIIINNIIIQQEEYLFEFLSTCRMVFIPPHFAMSTFDQVLRTYPVRKSVSSCTTMVQPGVVVAEYAMSLRNLGFLQHVLLQIQVFCDGQLYRWGNYIPTVSKGPRHLPARAW